MATMESWRAEFDERFPIYQQIVQQFQRSIVVGELSPGDRISSIRDMAMILKVNTNTIQRAYQELEKEGIIYSQRGMGYFVREDESLVENMKKEMVGEISSRFITEMKSLGFSKEHIIEEVVQKLEEDEPNVIAN